MKSRDGLGEIRDGKMLLKLKEKFYSIRQVKMLLSPESNKLIQTNRKPCQTNKIMAQCPLCKIFYFLCKSQSCSGKEFPIFH